MEEADRYRLPSAELERLYRDLVVPVVFDGVKSHQAHSQPTVVVFGGQPGAGKSAAVDATVSELGGASGRSSVAQIIGDDLRAYHPRYAEFMRKDDQTAALYTGKDVGRWVEMAIADAIKLRCSTVVEGTMRSPDTVARTVEQFREAGYRVEARVLAVPERLSWQGVLQRYEDQRAAKGTGRMSPEDMHAAAVRGVPQSLDRLQDQCLVDRIALYRRGGEVIFSVEQLPGQRWSSEQRASEALEAERGRPWTRSEHDKFVQDWQHLQGRLLAPGRHADQGELADVEQRLRRAQGDRAAAVFLSAERLSVGELPEVVAADRYMVAMAAAGRMAGLGQVEQESLKASARLAVAARLQHGLPPQLGPEVTRVREDLDKASDGRIAGADRSR